MEYGGFDVEIGEGQGGEYPPGWFDSPVNGGGTGEAGGQNGGGDDGGNGGALPGGAGWDAGWNGGALPGAAGGSGWNGGYFQEGNGAGGDVLGNGWNSWNGGAWDGGYSQNNGGALPGDSGNDIGNGSLPAAPPATSLAPSPLPTPTAAPTPSPKVTETPTPAPTPSPSPKKKKEKEVSPKRPSATPSRKKPKAEEYAPIETDLFYFRESTEITFDGRTFGSFLSLLPNTEEPIEILSLRVNKREAPWRWTEDCLKVEIPSSLSDKNKKTELQIELLAICEKTANLRFVIDDREK